MTEPTFLLAGVSLCGPGRRTNEDSIGLSAHVRGGNPDPVADGVPFTHHFGITPPTLVVVADGLGGHPAGEQASRIAVETILSSGPVVGSELAEAVTKADRAVARAGGERPEWDGMGTTVAALLLYDDRMSVANVGDSEVFDVTDGRLIRLTAPDVPEWGVGSHPGRSSVVTRWLGGGDRSPGWEPHLYDIARGPTRRLLLCTDGLSSVVPMAEIGDIVAEHRGESCIHTLLREVRDSRGEDDVTIVLVELAQPHELEGDTG